MRREILQTIKEKKALTTLYLVSGLGIIALSLSSFFADQKPTIQQLDSCQDVLRQNIATENLKRKNIIAIYNVQYSTLEIFKLKDEQQYQYVLNQIADPHDVFRLPKTELQKSKSPQAKAKLKTCYKNVANQFDTFDDLSVIFNDTLLEVNSIQEELSPQNPAQPVQN